MNTQVTPIKPEGQAFSLTPQSLDEAMKYADVIAKSDIVPSDYRNKPGNVLVAIQMGLELGLPPLQALQNIAVINGRPAVWGDSLIAIARAHPACEYIKETFDEKTMTATCKVKRRNQPEEVRTFSRADAETAGLWGKNTWKQYPKRMLQMRARSFAVRDVFSDALRGIAMVEEVQDIPPRDMGYVDRSDEKSAEPEVLPEYPEDQFKVYLPRWEEAILKGTKSADDVIATVETRYTLSADQKQQIKDLGKQPAQESDDWDQQYDAASQNGGE